MSFFALRHFNGLDNPLPNFSAGRSARLVRTWGVCAISPAYSFDGACTNWAESYFSRLRRAELGHHHHVAGAYLLCYAQEGSWREDNRRVANGKQVRRVAALAMGKKESPDFTGTGSGMSGPFEPSSSRLLEASYRRERCGSV